MPPPIPQSTNPPINQNPMNKCQGTIIRRTPLVILAHLGDDEENRCRNHEHEAIVEAIARRDVKTAGSHQASKERGSSSRSRRGDPTCKAAKNERRKWHAKLDFYRRRPSRPDPIAAQTWWNQASNLAERDSRPPHRSLVMRMRRNRG